MSVCFSAKKFGIDEVPSDVINLISHATQERLRDFLEKLSTIAEHRSEIYKVSTFFYVVVSVCLVGLGVYLL